MARLAKRGEIWMIDLGMAAKVRPCLILSVPFEGQEGRSLPTFLAPQVCAVAGLRWSIWPASSSQGHLMHRTSARCHQHGC